jgi:hypothetical protein
MKFFLIISIFLLLLSVPSDAANNSIHEACRRLCDVEVDCVHRCVGHAELMEVRAELVNVAAEFHKSPDVRLTALRTGASLETFEMCTKTGWSTENKLICLRSYPTASLIKACKNLSPREDDQVRCVRNGKTTAEVEACNRLLVSANIRLECVGLHAGADATETCDQKGRGSLQRLECLKGNRRAPASR